MNVYKDRYNDFIKKFKTNIYSLDRRFSNYIFLCIGTDKVTGDAFGPLVGKFLNELIENEYENIFIEGTLESPISYINIDERLEKIYKVYEDPCLIVIDSALSNDEEIGNIVVRKGKTNLGMGLNKKMHNIGDLSINGIIAKDYKIPKYNFYNLQNISLNFIMNFAQLVANGIYTSIAE